MVSKSMGWKGRKLTPTLLLRQGSLTSLTIGRMSGLQHQSEEDSHYTVTLSLPIDDSEWELPVSSRERVLYCRKGGGALHVWMSGSMSGSCVIWSILLLICRSLWSLLHDIIWWKWVSNSNIRRTNALVGCEYVVFMVFLFKKMWYHNF